MSRKYLIIETYTDGCKRQNYYYLMLPDVGEAGFYRQVESYNAFFFSMRNPHANVTSVRQFTTDDRGGITIRKKFLKDVKWGELRTFETIWSFYEFIGYDRKSRKYKSGEVLKIFNGSYFVLPKSKKGS